MTRWSSVVGASLLVAGMLGVGAPGIAAACACGGVVSSDPTARIADEEALVAMNDGSENIVMRLSLQSKADNAALIVPTPTPATVTASSPSLFGELDALSAPRVETRRHWKFSLPLLAGGAQSAAPPTVVAQVQLGPLEATTLTGGDESGVRQWLDSHGYNMRPEVVAQLDPYLKQGWAFVAMRLTSDSVLDGQLAPVQMQFASDRLVYPMRMSAAAKNPERVVIYTLGQHRMQRSDPDAARQHVDLEYAGSIAGRTHDQALTEMAGDGPFLTKTSVDISDPAAITSDFEFVAAPKDDAFQQVVYRDKDVDLLPFFLLGGVLLFMAAFVAALVLVIFALTRRRSPR